MKVLIVCNGEAPPRDLLRGAASESDLIIGADGGGLTLLEAGITPDIVLGDMDSFDEEDHPGLNVLSLHDQETNDLEKALDYALKQGARSGVIMGAFGKRVDHGLKNLSVLYAYSGRFDSLCFRDVYQDIYLIESPFKARFPVNTTISLIPLSGKVKGVSTKGLAWPLKNEDLVVGERDGTSNRSVKEEVEISFESGRLLLCKVHPAGMQIY
jgi:thiamine pyrophosphokinase